MARRRSPASKTRRGFADSTGFEEKKVGDLEAEYRISELPSSPFHNLIQGIARSISRSWSHA